jgi:hypothetical protein
MKPIVMRCATLFFLSCLPVAGYSAELTIVDVQGRAFDLESGKLVYQEFHCDDPDQNQTVVEYYDVADKKILSKWLDYKTGFLTPSMVQLDVVSKQTVAMSLVENSINMDGDNFSKPVFLKIDTDLPLVIDAGFDHFIRDYWNELIAGRRLEFQFPVVARQSIFNFEITASNCQYDSQQDQCFSMKPGNWFLSALLDPIELGYDPVSRRLKRYRGLSNVEDKNGAGYEVDIHYQYQASAGKRCDPINPDLLRMQAVSSPGETFEDSKK